MTKVFHLAIWRKPETAYKTSVAPKIWLDVQARGPFLEGPGNLTGPESNFGIKVWRKVGRVLTSDEVHFVSLAENFTVQFLKTFETPSRMENKTA